MAADDVVSLIREFVDERDWRQFHSLENLAKSISIEAGELLECFQWGVPDSLSNVHDELADVLTYCYLLAEQLGAVPAELITDKLAKTKRKYPTSKARGTSKKYDEL